MDKSEMRKIEDCDTKHLDFGAGFQRRNPFSAREIYSVDLFEISSLPNHWKIDRMAPLPFPDAFFDSVSAYDVLEHLSRDLCGENEFIFYMNELSRVMKKDAKAVFIFPSFPHQDAFSDPTHINFITPKTLDYFLGDNRDGTYAGITSCFALLKNKPLRYWKNWVYLSVESDEIVKLDFRRKCSLLKRSLIRFLFPQHTIWVVKKI